MLDLFPRQRIQPKSKTCPDKHVQYNKTASYKVRKYASAV